MYYVYILKSAKCNKYYIGCSYDLEARLKQHNSGSSRWTRDKGVWELVYQERCLNKGEALKREKFIKRQKSRVYIDNLINNIVKS